MAVNFYTLITTTGKAKMANAAALGTKVNFKTLKVGDGNGNYYEPTENQTNLLNTVWQGDIGSISIDENNSNWIVTETTIPATDGGFFIREAGIFDEDGNLIAISKMAETYKPVAAEGSTKNLIVQIILEVSNSSSVTLKIDPNVVIATKNDIAILTNSINSITTQLSEITQKQNKFTEDANGKLLYNGNKVGATKASELTLDPISGMSSTNVQAGIAEAFQYANNGKTSIANVVGKVTGSNTHAQIASEIQTDKNTMATNITSKGISANGTETLASLAGKVGQISVASLGGKKFATNTATISSSASTFEYLTGATDTSTYITVTGLSFKPSVIIIMAYETGGTSSTYITVYDELGLNTNNYMKTAKLLSCSAPRILNYRGQIFKGDTYSAIVQNGGFTLPIQQGTSNQCTWLAYE